MALETDEILLASWDDSAGTGGTQPNGTTTTSAWFAQHFVPDTSSLPAGARAQAFSVTRANARIGKTGSPVDTIFLRVYTADAVGKPVTQKQSLSITSVANTWTAGLPDWLTSDMTFTTATGLDALLGACLVLAQTAITGSSVLGTQSAATPSPSGYLNSNSSGGAWTGPSATRAWYYQVWGKIQYLPPADAKDPPLDNAASLTITAGSGATTHTLALDVSAGVNNSGALYVAVAQTADSASDGVCTGVTYAGLDMLELPGTGLGAADSRLHREYVKWFRLLQPPVGTADVVATFNGVDHYGTIGAASYFDVHQQKPEGGTYTALLASSANGYADVGVLGDLHLVALAFDPTTGTTTTATAQGNTLKLGGATVITSPLTTEGGLFGSSSPSGGNNNVGWSISPIAQSLALSVIGINNISSLPSPDYSNFPKQILRSPAKVYDQPDNGPL